MPTDSDRACAFAGLLAASLLVAAPIQPALAQSDTDTEVQTRTVETRGLNLASASDQALLRHRIRMAARQVCGEYEGGPQNAFSDGFRGCVDKAVADASATLNVLIASAGAVPTTIAETTRRTLP